MKNFFKNAVRAIKIVGLTAAFLLASKPDNVQAQSYFAEVGGHTGISSTQFSILEGELSPSGRKIDGSSHNFQALQVGVNGKLYFQNNSGQKFSFHFQFTGAKDPSHEEYGRLLQYGHHKVGATFSYENPYLINVNQSTSLGFGTNIGYDHQKSSMYLAETLTGIDYYFSEIGKTYPSGSPQNQILTTFRIDGGSAPGFIGGIQINGQKALNVATKLAMCLGANYKKDVGYKFTGGSGYGNEDNFSYFGTLSLQKGNMIYQVGLSKGNGSSYLYKGKHAQTAKNFDVTLTVTRAFNLGQPYSDPQKKRQLSDKKLNPVLGL